jgi:hypothetical protein
VPLESIEPGRGTESICAPMHASQAAAGAWGLPSEWTSTARPRTTDSTLEYYDLLPDLGLAVSPPPGHPPRRAAKVINYFYAYAALVSRPLAGVRVRARAVYLFSYGISRAEFFLGSRYLK